MQCRNSEAASARNLECLNAVHLSDYLDDSRYGAFIWKSLLKVTLFVFCLTTTSTVNVRWLHIYR